MARRRSRRMRLETPRVSTSRLLAKALAILALYIAAALAVELAGAGHNASSSGVVEVSDPSLFHDYVSSGTVLAFFKSEGCPGCKLVEPAVLRLAREGAGVRVVVAHVDKMMRADAGAALELFSELEVYGTPTLIVFRDGIEVARHIGTSGAGDQYLRLKEFVEAALEGRLSSTTAAVSSTAAGGSRLLRAALQAVGAFTLGLLGALSPCSLPVVLAYSSMQRGREGRLLQAFIYNTAGVAAAAAIVGMLLAALYIVGSGLAVNLYVLAVAFGASLVAAWGIEFLRGHKPLIGAGGRLGRLLPLLGLQCSLPFLIAMIALVESAPHIVAAASIMFALGYSVPYALAASLGSSLALRLEAFMRSSAVLRLQGALLVAVGVYILSENLDALLTLS
ncbi:MAG: thioredoxin domain-containing protein [Thermoproteota archaeon]